VGTLIVTGILDVVTRKLGQLPILVFISDKKRIQARHENVVKVIVKFISKEI
jgi:hypothetical protein